MRKSRFSDEQIIAILKEHQAGFSAAESCRKHGVSDATFYKWRSKYGGMEASVAKRLWSLDDGKRCSAPRSCAHPEWRWWRS